MRKRIAAEVLISSSGKAHACAYRESGKAAGRLFSEVLRMVPAAYAYLQAERAEVAHPACVPP